MSVEVETAREAHEPPEARGLPRDGVKLLVGQGGHDVSHHCFAELPRLLRAGDLLVVNTSATLPAAVPVADGRGLVVHFSTELPYVEPRAEPGGAWLVEVRGRGGRDPHGASEPGTALRTARRGVRRSARALPGRPALGR